ncbi:unnamed protein product [Didymodactylos carnosus]|uniref:SERTA domain-containing protein n=1 Tax=Didymodactylos carnosus TaxID=1234261 RepID=A0A8S2GH75_9BILA|nr:unnamed protein product [Didymodactylos carnosus]CAF3493103.1 unnamed protein product [Didymodactylos carnosus]
MIDDNIFNQLIMCDNIHFCKTQLYPYTENNHYYMDVNEAQTCYLKRKLSESDDQEDELSSEESEDDLDENEEDSDEDNNQQHSHSHNHQDISDIYDSNSCYQPYSASVSKLNLFNRCSTITTRRHSDTIVAASKAVSSTTTPIVKRRYTYSTMHDDEQKRTVLLESYRKLRGIKKPKLHVSLMICNLIKCLEKTFKTPSSSTTTTSMSHSCSNTSLTTTTTALSTNTYPMRTPPQHYGLTSTHDQQYSSSHLHHSRTSFRSSSSDSISPQLLDFNDIMYSSSSNVTSNSLINDSISDIIDNNNCPYTSETKTHLNDYINETYTPFHHHYSYSPPLISSTQYCAVSSSASSLPPQLQQSITIAPSIITSTPNAKDILLSTYYDVVPPILVTENTNSNCELNDNTGVSSTICSSTSCVTSHYNTDTFWTTLDSLQQSNFAIPASIVSEDELIAPHGGGEYIDISGNTLSAYTFCHTSQTNTDSLPDTNSSVQSTISTTTNSSDRCCNEKNRTIIDEDSPCIFTTNNNSLQSSDLCTILSSSNTNELDMNNNETFSSLTNVANMIHDDLSSSSSCIIIDPDNNDSLIANNNISFYQQVTTSACSYSPSSSSSSTDYTSSPTYYHTIMNYNLHESSRTNNGIITTA